MLNKLRCFMFDGDVGFSDNGAIIGGIIILAIFLIAGFIDEPPMYH